MKRHASTPSAVFTASSGAALGLCLIGVIGITPPAAHGQTAIQSITLQPGWNAIYFEVQPAENRPGSVFAGWPVAGVWTRAERLSSAEYIQNPTETEFNNPAWLRWFPSPQPEALLNNLFAVLANRAYLIKATNTLPMVWNVVGRPALRQPEWVPDSFNLRGLPVDPTVPPTFLNFFRPSKAHYDAATGQLQKIYRLSGGQWTPVAPGATIASGEAYWIFTKGASDYLAPLSVRVDFGDGLDYGLELTELNLRLRNLATLPANVLLRDLASPPGNGLSYYQFHPTLGGQWPVWTSPLAVPVAAGAETRLRLGARRQDFSGASYATVLEVRDGAGTRLRVPLAAAKFMGVAAAAAGFQPASMEPLAGLWVGAATINAVAEAHSADPANPTPTKSELNLRLVLHVDASGQTRLLKEVIQMWRDGTYTNDASGNRVVDKPGQHVLLTDDTLIPLFQGSTVRDGQPVGRRISTIGYDFPSSPTSNYLALAGTFAIGQAVTGTLTLPYDHPNNPFQHKYHPDHDNLDGSFGGPAMEAYTTTREVELSFSASPPAGTAVLDFGYNEMGGTYRETITGVHKRPIPIRGTFRLSRVSRIPELNPSPTP